MLSVIVLNTSVPDILLIEYIKSFFSKSHADVNDYCQ